MRLGKLTALAGLIIISMAFIISCSDDDTAVTPTVTYGSNDDPEFVPVQAQIDSILYNIIDDASDGMDNLNAPPGEPYVDRGELAPGGETPIDTDPDTLIHVYMNNWHYTYIHHTSNTYEARLRDSVQFRQNGDPTETPDDNTDYVHVINNWNFNAVNQSTNHTDYVGRNELVISNLNQQIANIQGNSESSILIHYANADTAYAGNFNFNVTVNNLYINKVNDRWKNACPSSGTINMLFSYNSSWETQYNMGSANSEWTVSVVFNDGDATVTATNGTSTWQYICEVCSTSSGIE